MNKIKFSKLCQQNSLSQRNDIACIFWWNSIPCAFAIEFKAQFIACECKSKLRMRGKYYKISKIKLNENINFCA